MGLFSTTPDLHPEVQEALSPEFHAGIIGTRDYNPGIRKLANAQERLREQLARAQTMAILNGVHSNAAGLRRWLEKRARPDPRA